MLLSIKKKINLLIGMSVCVFYAAFKEHIVCVPMTLSCE